MSLNNLRTSLVGPPSLRISSLSLSTLIRLDSRFCLPFSRVDPGAKFPSQYGSRGHNTLLFPSQAAPLPCPLLSPNPSRFFKPYRLSFPLDPCHPAHYGRSLWSSPFSRAPSLFFFLSGFWRRVWRVRGFEVVLVDGFTGFGSSRRFLLPTCLLGAGRNYG